MDANGLNYSQVCDLARKVNSKDLNLAFNLVSLHFVYLID